MIWNGVPLGFTRDGKAFGWPGTAPTLVFGPPGSGKTVKLIANQLLDDDSGTRSYVVIDPKGEVCALTSKFRRKVGDVKIINPYGLLVDQRPDMASDQWNPLAGLDPGSATFNDEIAALGDALIKTDSNEHQKHFPNSARSAATGFAMQEVKDAMRDKRAPSLLRVRVLLTQDVKPMRATVKRMVAEGDPAIVTRVAKFLDDTDELANIKSTFETESAWMNSPPMQNDLNTAEGVDFRDCRKRATTIYIIVPTEELDNKAVYLRLVLSSALRNIYRQRGLGTTLIVEEGFVIGHLAVLEQALSIARGFSANLTIVFQSIAQIKQLYPNTWGLFLSGAVCGFRPGDLETATWMSQRAGENILPVLSAADPSGPGDLGARPSWQQQNRARIPIAKLFSMPDAKALVWVPGSEAPTLVHAKAYFEIAKLAARASPNPYYAGAGAGGGRRGAAGGGMRGAATALCLGVGALLAAWALGW
jgi:type IV secretion system protein VirD4